MTTPKHTPGPWTVFRQPDLVSIMDASGKTIANWQLPEPGPDHGPSVCEQVGEEDAANIALIASAPALVGALSALLHLYETPGDFTPEERGHVLEDADQALRSAGIED